MSLPSVGPQAGGSGSVSSLRFAANARNELHHPQDPSQLPLHILAGGFRMWPHCNHLRSFTDSGCVSLPPRDSDLICKSWGLGIGGFQCSPGDSPVQPWQTPHYTTASHTATCTQTTGHPAKAGLLLLQVWDGPWESALLPGTTKDPFQWQGLGQHSGSQSGIPGPMESASPQNLLERYVLRSQPRPMGSEALEAGARYLWFNKPSNSDACSCSRITGTEGLGLSRAVVTSPD